MNKILIGRVISNSAFQYLLLFFLAVIIWQIYYPGIMSPDSLNQYGQAYYGFFEDAHPPLMSIVLWMLMRIGGNIGILLFIQCLCALFGLRSLISLVMRFFAANHVSRQLTGMLSTAATILFLIPFFYAFHVLFRYLLERCVAGYYAAVDNLLFIMVIPKSRFIK